MLVLAGLGGVIVLLGVGTFLFQAGCALADVPERGYVRSLPVYSVAVVVCLPLAAALVWYAGRFDAAPAGGFGLMRVAALVVGLLLSWLVSAGIYSLFLSASIKKGLVVAGVELLLMALVSALVAGIVLLVLAFVQIANRAPPTAVSLPPSIVRLAPPAARE